MKKQGCHWSGDHSHVTALCRFMYNGLPELPIKEFNNFEQQY